MRRLRRAKYRRIGLCNICGKLTVFCGVNASSLTPKKQRNDLACMRCGAVARNRALAAAVLDLYGGTAQSLRALGRAGMLRELHIYNTTARGAVHAFLRTLPHYVCSEYFPDIPAGTLHGGVRCEDLQALSFPDATFDLVISEDVLEHVRSPGSALQEIRRVLKPGGYHVFTVPIFGDKTVVRVDTTTKEDVCVLPPLYHGDPLREKGALAYHDFGRDIVDLCAAQAFAAQLLEFETTDRRWLCGDVIVARKPGV